MSDTLKQKHCAACEGIGSPLNAEQIENLLPQLNNDWHLINNTAAIKRSFAFKNFYETMACVNAIAWIANTENHHPDLEIGYNYCHVKFITHALNGLSFNDFICAAKIDALFT
ncbi:MAG: 4a-hydroxytetrahydrobiopterin dehydratase [Legionellales bacterium RIFCSPHIGHO2_12_FULL_35_11]|nr:MAG: 4a-hydroxytetrahydrobiopterin dehydratase [Legionellales bacterium RIFCSPHIGHO2_12_FULL_35_11]